MKKWLKFFFLSFFSHKTSREAVKRGYTNTFLGFILALTFIFGGLVGGEMLPFGMHYDSSPDFKATVHAVMANADPDKRILLSVEKGSLRVKLPDGEYADGLLINTLENEEDRVSYSVNGVGVVIDLRPAGTLAEVEAYCVSNDGENTRISYEEYLTLNEVPRLNFDFKLRYTGRELILTDEMIGEYKAYVEGLGDEAKGEVDRLSSELTDGKITKSEYDKGIYELYFKNYYPPITAYESSSAVPLLRNYYYHQYISQGTDSFLFIFDDYMAGSFNTKGGVNVQFYGFFSGLDDGSPVGEEMSQAEANSSADRFVKDSFSSNWFLNVYAHLVNVISLAPTMALMLLVAALLSYSVMRLLGVESIASLGEAVKVVGAFSYFAGLIAALFAIVISFFVNHSVIVILPIAVFFIVLIIRSVIFIIKEKKLQQKQSEQQPVQTEV